MEDTQTILATGLKRIIYLTLGWLSLVTGILGIILPVMPGVIFLVLSAGFFVKSSHSMYHWVTNNRYFGKYIREYEEKRGMHLTGKIIAFVILWISIAVSFFLFAKILLYKIILLAVGAGISIYLILIKTIKK